MSHHLGPGLIVTDTINCNTDRQTADKIGIGAENLDPIPVISARRVLYIPIQSVLTNSIFRDKLTAWFGSK